MKFMKEILIGKYIGGCKDNIFIASNYKDSDCYTPLSEPFKWLGKSGYLYFLPGSHTTEIDIPFQETIEISEKYKDSLTSNFVFDPPVKIGDVKVVPDLISTIDIIRITVRFFDENGNLILDTTFQTSEQSDKMAKGYWVNIIWCIGGMDTWIDDTITNIPEYKRKYGFCKQCGKPFSISTGEMKWFEDKGFELPKKCYNCRKRRINV